MAAERRPCLCDVPKKTPQTPPSATFPSTAHWLRWLCAPVWVLALTTEAKSFKDNPILGSRRLSRASLDIARVRLAHLLDEPEPQAVGFKENSLVVADTSGFHARGASRHPSTRIEIWGYGRRNLFLPWTGWDLQGLPGLKGGTVPLYWRARNLAEALGLRRNPWRRVAPTDTGHE